MFDWFLDIPLIPLLKLLSYDVCCIFIWTSTRPQVCLILLIVCVNSLLFILYCLCFSEYVLELLRKNVF